MLALQPGTERYPAPAKINRFLHVTGRDAAGYHMLQTVFQFLEWGDALDIRPRDDRRICLAGDLSGLPAEQNLVWRAAHALQETSARAAGADITIHKQIPAGSGLGGGSSDAATVLVALNRLWALNYSEARLCELGLGLGADVPVFIHGRACFAEGRGEKMRDVEPDEGPVCVFLPVVHSSTAAVFSRPEMVRDSAPIAHESWPEAVRSARNDCENAALAESPELRQIAAQLRLHADFRMSGTGSAFFALAPSRKNLRRIAGLVGAVPGRVVTSSVTNLSPLHMKMCAASSATGFAPAPTV